MAKKKKAAANPARGFATTSVASKPKVEKLEDVEPAAPKKEVQNVPEPVSQVLSAAAPITKPVQQTPEELEAQLEHDELQLLVEKHASKTRREANRQVSKFQTDRRVLRSQSEAITVHDWLPRDILDEIIVLAQTELNSTYRKQGQQSLLKVLSEEDATAKLWALDLTFRELGFTPEHIQPVLTWLCAHAGDIDASATLWGFQEGLEWLALDQCDGHSFSYEEPKPKPIVMSSPSISRPGTPLRGNTSADLSNLKTPSKGTPTAATPNNATPIMTPAESDLSDVPVSDLDSDLEPDQLIPTYLKIKGRLFELDPETADSSSRRQGKGSKGRGMGAPTTTNPVAIRKLMLQLQQLESDALFDRYEADVQWPEKRNQIAQAMAVERQTQGPSVQPKAQQTVSESPPISTRTASPAPSSVPSSSLFEQEEPDMLGAMFSAIPDEVLPAQATSLQLDAPDVLLRDFGKQSGLAPRRLLEEAVRARDPSARVTFAVVSPTLYSCRHALSITWFKSHDFFANERLRTTITATTIATVSVEQSENFVSTAALFSLFSGSSREEKTHLRLPANWRDLYREFLEFRKERVDSEDRTTIKHLRSIVRDQIDNEESDGVANQTTSSPSGSGRATPSLPSTPSFQHMLAVRNRLPVSGFLTIICGETGCGKSKPCKVYCTEPRLSEELGEGPKDIGTLRSIVGYAIRLESKMTPQTRLSAGNLNEVSHLVIDEVHERSIDTDFLLIILRSLMERRPELKRFSRYLNDAPVLNVPGRTFPVQTKYLEDAIELTHYVASEEKREDPETSEDEEGSTKEKSGIPSKLPGYSSTTRSVLKSYDEYAIDYELIVRVIDSAFLVFLPGLAEIRTLNDILSNQQAAFVIPPPGMRKIVLATNIAETGVTIPDITCVIDTGKHKEMRFDERRQLSRLTQSFISRANAKQRRGRAGRYRHDSLMAEQQTPEMLRLSLQDLVMRTKICKLGDIERTLADALDPPSSRNIRRAIDALIEVDALTTGEELTPLGRQLAKLPMFGCVDSPFLTPFGAKQRADIARFAFKKGDSDLLTTYNAYKTWKNNFLSAQNLGNIEDLKAQLLSSLSEAGCIQLSPDERRNLSRYRSTTRHRTFVSNDILVNSVIAMAFYPKILIRDGKGWRNISNNQTVSIAPTSVNKPTVINPITAKFLSYYHIMQSSNKFYNAHSTNIAHPLPMILMVGADMDFKLHAGVIQFPGNVLRFAVKEWRAMVALKVLRRRVKEILAQAWRNPGRAVGERDREWMELFFKVFEEKWVKEEKVRERAGGKGK
ncbi:hypothetical protein P154DRAFT_553670 [Amniculicola lignicola CBS 123094]|uniref:Helicase C-terminal domain-containing protein n=1 Tax=Amniculicola lignicola CBS 123094 TaxID=1392246 RepID=A0A6A5WMJ4_9PLEO|nr:hypothetical protein P154DRAFT_553670 [Amniculicola lignicola CBS 123094]